MSNYSFKGTKIQGRKIHFGDKYNYSTHQEYLKNEAKSYTETERELVKIIYENTSSEEERQDILESLSNIRNVDIDEDEKEKSILTFKPLLRFLKKAGKKVLYSKVTDYLTGIISKENIKDLFS